MNILAILRSLASRLFKDIAPIQRNELLENKYDLWQRMYRNVMPHGKQYKGKTLNLPASICAEFARLITIENEIKITGSLRADFMNKQLTHLLSHLRIQVEYACASGGMIFKPYVVDKSIHTACLTQENFLPIAWEHKHLTGCLFWDYYVEGKYCYTLIEKQLYKDGVHTIECRAFVSTNKNTLGKEISLEQTTKWNDIDPLITIKGVDRPLFGYFRIPIGNQIDTQSPLGVPVYSRAVERIEDADRQWTYLMWEFEGGQLAVDAPMEWLRKRDGEDSALPQYSERLFRRLNIDTSDVNNGYNVFSPSLRDESLINGLDAIKREIEFDCCLAYGTLSNPQNVDKTAEEIRASKQRSYTTVCDMQASLENALIEYIYAVDKLADVCNLSPQGKYDIQFNWGDGVLEDAKTEQSIRLQEVNSRIIRKEDYLMWRYGVTEEQAKEMLPRSDGVDSYFNDMELR